MEQAFQFGRLYSIEEVNGILCQTFCKKNVWNICETMWKEEYVLQVFHLKCKRSLKVFARRNHECKNMITKTC